MNNLNVQLNNEINLIQDKNISQDFNTNTNTNTVTNTNAITNTEIIPIFKNDLINKEKYKKIKNELELKEFDKINKESTMILNNLKPDFFVTSVPSNPYVLFLWLVVILIIIFLIIEYINKDKFINNN
jgi:hypothetical protein